MHAMCRRHAPCRMKYQPVKMKTVLTKLRQAFKAGRSEIENTFEALKGYDVFGKCAASNLPVSAIASTMASLNFSF